MPIDLLYPQKYLHATASATDRPRFHFAPPACWMNDPNGLVWFRGRYHLFHQCNPLSPLPGRMGWGHATSLDGLHWEYQPLVLVPDGGFAEEGSDLPAGGCFTGSPIVKDDRLYLLYTNCTSDPEGSTTQLQHLAFSDDGMTFHKIPSPVIASYPPDGSEQFRDPKVWKHGEHWYCIIGSCRNGLGNVLLYRSDDLQNWTYIGESLRAESAQTQGWMWECPSLFSVNGVDILMISPMGLENQGVICAYFVGNLDYQTGRFTPRSFHSLCHSPEFYSAQVYQVDGYDAPVLISWMQHWVVPEYPTVKEGWNGVHSLHYLCGYDSVSDRLTLRPVPQIKTLRIKEVSLDKIESHSFEVLLSASLPDSSTSGSLELQLCRSEDGTEYTSISYNVSSGILTVDCSHSGKKGGNLVSSGLVGRENRTLNLQIFVDCCSIEVLAGSGTHLFSHRIFPSSGSNGATLSTSNIKIQDLHVFQLDSIYNISND